MKEKLILDGTKLIYHLARLNAWNKDEKIFPIFIEISPIGFCNQSCTFCAYDYLKKTAERLDPKRIFRLLDEFALLGVKSVFYSGEGEPLLYPEMVKVIRRTHALGLDCALNTNGILMLKDVSKKILKDLSWVRFSINAGNRKSYKRIHRAGEQDFDRLMQNLEDAVEIKRKYALEVSLGVQLVYIKQPVREIWQFARFLKNKGLDYFAIKQFNKHPFSRFDIRITSQDIEALKKIEALSDDRFYVTVRESFDAEKQLRKYKKCFGFDFFAEIKCDGGVYPCGPLLGIKKYCYGNINKDTFRDIWLGEKRARVLQGIYRDVDVARCMPNCRLHHINDFLWQLKNVPEHVNFI